MANRGIYAHHPGENPIKILNEGASPEYSPVKNEIVYYGTKFGDGISLNIYNFDSKQTTFLTCTLEPNQSGQGVYDVQWSPDGKKLAYSHNKEGDFNVYVFDIEDSTEIKLTKTGFNFVPQWSPDGLSIAYFEWNSKNIEVVNIDGSQLRILNLNIDGYLGFPFWLSDGRIITTFSKDSSSMYFIDLIIINQDLSTIDFKTSDHLTYFGCNYNNESVIIYHINNELINLELLNIHTYTKSSFLDINEIALGLKVSPDFKWLSYKVPHDSLPVSNLCLFNIDNKTKRIIAEEVHAKYSWSSIYN
jgi:Tol biopolymer transport system component